MRQRRCVLCENIRVSGSKYCPDCAIYGGSDNHGSFEQTPWYRELLRLESKQKRINAMEAFPLKVDHAADIRGVPLDKPAYVFTRSGRPVIYTDAQAEEIRALFLDTRLSVRKLTQILHERGIRVSRETVRKILVTARASIDK